MQLVISLLNVLSLIKLVHIMTPTIIKQHIGTHIGYSIYPTKL